ncbi:MAG: pilus assembly protein PilP [Gammaproteobacteria bacterium]|nr:pilus assembly protein PilP [Gammaproteobacteria bacterium]
MSIPASTFRFVVIALLVFLLTACGRSETFVDLQQFVGEVQARPGEEVEPLPTFEAYEAFAYSAAGLRGPFDIPVIIQQSDGSVLAENVKPDFERVLEVLESHAIAELAMVGMMERKSIYVALVEDELGEVHRLKLGNYLGRNHGRVVFISETQLNLIEIVPNGNDGWVERPQSLVLTR